MLQEVSPQQELADELQAAIAEAHQYQTMAAQTHRSTPPEVSRQVLVCVHHIHKCISQL